MAYHPLQIYRNHRLRTGSSNTQRWCQIYSNVHLHYRNLRRQLYPSGLGRYRLLADS